MGVDMSCRSRSRELAPYTKPSIFFSIVNVSVLYGHHSGTGPSRQPIFETDPMVLALGPSRLMLALGIHPLRDGATKSGPFVLMSSVICVRAQLGNSPSLSPSRGFLANLAPSSMTRGPLEAPCHVGECCVIFLMLVVLYMYLCRFYGDIGSRHWLVWIVSCEGTSSS